MAMDKKDLLIPSYLKPIAYNVTTKGDFTKFHLKCNCGYILFDIFESYLDKDEQKACKPHYDALMELYSGGGASICTVDNDGTVHHWKLLSSDRNGPKQEVIVPSLPVFGRIHTIKIKCSQCGREYILFDSRFNGYSGKFCANATDEEAAYIPHFKQKKRRDGLPVEICVSVEHDPSYDEFKQNTGIECSFEDYEDAYTWITIYAIDKSGKKIKMFEVETD